MPVLQLIELGLERALEVGADALRGEPIAFSEADLLLPYKPPSVRDFVTFESHVEGVRKSIDDAAGIPEAWYDAPHFYFTNPHALYGPGEAIPRPVTCRALDFEMEVGVVVGSTLRSASVEEAEAAIFGYTIVNDWSARDIQKREMQIGLGPAKGKDFATSIGPWIVTADELPSLDLDCKAYVNGELIGHDRLSLDELDLRRDDRPRLARLGGAGRRPARLRHDRRRRLPGRAVGPQRLPDPAAARARRRGPDRGRGLGVLAGCGRVSAPAAAR